jgi:L-lactate dehydrogenase
VKVGIVGSGLVGATAAYALVMRGVGREIVLLDKNRARAAAEADDIQHAVPFAHPLEVRVGDYGDLKGSRVVVLTAGVGQRPGETRLELLARNAAVFREIVPAVLDAAPQAVLVVATNPVDVMTHLVTREAVSRGVPSGRVFGSGTTLDTARFRSLLARVLGVDSAHVHAYVVGEHGDSEVLTWSLVTVGGLPLHDYCEAQGLSLDAGERQALDRGVREAAYRIIGGKGATYYGVGSALARIVDVVLSDQRAVLTVCAPTDDVCGVKDVTVSLPRIVGGEGILATLPLPLDAAEGRALCASAGVVRAAITALGGPGPQA